jgi:hypothetical protein
MGAWNARGAFGKNGEQAFATTMYKYMMKSGRYTSDEAASLVREALGNYQNVRKVEKDFIGRFIFFYPWLKGNMAYWVRKLGDNPKYIAAPEQSARANNALVRILIPPKIFSG